MQMYVPSIGDDIELLSAWEFPLYLEYRNAALINRIRPNLNVGYGSNDGSIIAVLEKGTVLRVSRIYIRSGKSEWDSITFNIVSAPKDKKRAKLQKARASRWVGPDEVKAVPDTEQVFKGARFWAKLIDVNDIKFKKVEK